MVERVKQFDVFPSCSSLARALCFTTSVTNLQKFLMDEPRHQLSTDHFSHVPVVTGTVPPALSTDSREICRSVIGSSESSEFKSDLGLRIIDTACLFCVAGSDWWANYENVVEDIGLKHEIDETREAVRYKFGDGGTLVSSIRVTAPVLVAGKKSRIVFSVGPSKHLPLLIDRDFLTPARAVVDMGETLRIGTGVDNLVVGRAGHQALRLNPRDWHKEANLIRRYPSASPCMTEDTGPSDRRTALINRDSFDQFTSAWCGPCSTSFPSRRRCVLLERQRKSKARVGCTLAWFCIGHRSATRTAVVGTSNSDRKMQQRSRSTRNGIRTVATWSDASCTSCTAGVHLVVKGKLQKTCSWTSISLRRNAHVTRPGALNSLISPTRMSFVQRAQIVSVPLQRTPEQHRASSGDPFSASATWETLHLLHHCCSAASKRCLRRHHFNVRQRP